MDGEQIKAMVRGRYAAAAIGNAFYNATGVRMRSIPMTPSNVLAALGKTSGDVTV